MDGLHPEAGLEATARARACAARIRSFWRIVKLRRASRWRGSGEAEKRPNAWLGARSLSSEPMRAQVVRCQLQRSTQFMTEGDCRARGGRF
jgi:hypothetical protein